MVTKTKTEHDEHLLYVLHESKDTFDKCGEKINTVIGIKEKTNAGNADFSNTIAKKALQALETTGGAFFKAQQGVQECKERLTQGLNLENNQEEKSESTSNLTFSRKFSSGAKE